MQLQDLILPIRNPNNVSSLLSSLTWTHRAPSIVRKESPRLDPGCMTLRNPANSPTLSHRVRRLIYPSSTQGEQQRRRQGRGEIDGGVWRVGRNAPLTWL